MKPRFEGRTRRWARVVCTGLVLMAPLAPVWAVEYVWPVSYTHLTLPTILLV